MEDTVTCEVAATLQAVGWWLPWLQLVSTVRVTSDHIEGVGYERLWHSRGFRSVHEYFLPKGRMNLRGLIKTTERVDVAVTSSKSVREVFGSNPGLSWFPSVPLGKFRDSAYNRPRSLPSKYFPIYQSFIGARGSVGG
jgi:hypothetical protein